MRVSIVQSALRWEDKAANLSSFAENLRSLAGKTDLVVLPEMFTTGFTMRPAPHAEGPLGPTLTWVRAQAERLDAAVTGSFIQTDKHNYFNTLFFATPGGTVSFYNKRHLFSLAGEDKVFKPGRRRLTVEWRGWRICPMVCYDLRFPVWSRNRADDKGYDLLLYVANWPAPRIEHWKTLLAARAIENLAYVAGCNVVGRDGNGHEYTGDSAILDFMGKAVWTETGKEAIGTASLDKMALVNWRNAFPALRDADRFSVDR